MNALIMRLNGNGFDNLQIVGDADPAGAAIRAAEQTVIKAAATAKAKTAPSEGKAGNEDDVE
ncbi:MAG: hypothetical protein R3F13_20175 [Prosthecobacter sp.]